MLFAYCVLLFTFCFIFFFGNALSNFFSSYVGFFSGETSTLSTFISGRMLTFNFRSKFLLTSLALVYGLYYLGFKTEEWPGDNNLGGLVCFISGLQSF